MTTWRCEEERCRWFRVVVVKEPNLTSFARADGSTSETYPECACSDVPLTQSLTFSGYTEEEVACPHFDITQQQGGGER